MATSMKKKGRNRKQRGNDAKPVTLSQVAGASQDIDTQSEEPSSKSDMDMKFEQELYWCIEQLQMGLLNQKPTSRQAQEATKILKTLKNPKAAMIKKRQVMRNTFGDYRKKMADEEKKYAASVKQMHFSPVHKGKVQKSTFYKRSISQRTPTVGDGDKTDALPQPEDRSCFGTAAETDTTEIRVEYSDSNCDSDSKVGETNTDSITEAISNFHFQSSDNSFRFNFAVPNNGNNCDEKAEFSGNVMTESTHSTNPPAVESVNYYKMEKSDNNFKFNFPQQT